jgi:hypothetical protein
VCYGAPPRGTMRDSQLSRKCSVASRMLRPTMRLLEGAARAHPDAWGPFLEPLLGQAGHECACASLNLVIVRPHPQVAQGSPEGGPHCRLVDLWLPWVPLTVAEAPLYAGLHKTSRWMRSAVPAALTFGLPPSPMG